MGQGRTTNDEVLAACLATGVTVVEAAKAANVSASHAYRKCKEPEVAA